MTQWGPLIVVAVYADDNLGLALTTGVAISVFNITVDFLCKLAGWIRGESIAILIPAMHEIVSAGVRSCAGDLQCVLGIFNFTTAH